MEPDWDPAPLMLRLSRDAQALSAGQRCPVDIALVARRLGLEARWGARDLLPAEGALLQGRDGWTVAVTEADPNRPRARFTMAHEIGHFLLESYGVPRPVSDGDYWRLETLCHHFAGQLLVPPTAVRWVAEGASADPRELLRRSLIVSHRARISPQALSHRLSQDLSYAAFCEVGLTAPRTGVSGVVDWIVEHFSWLGLRAKSYVTVDHFLASSLDALRRLVPNQLWTGYLNGLPVAALRRRESVWLLGLEPALLDRGRRTAPQLSLPLRAPLRPASVGDVASASAT